VHAAVNFVVDNYREMYEMLTQVNIRGILEDPYLRRKLEAMWAHVYERGW
jgi:hypothetical protein